MASRTVEVVSALLTSEAPFVAERGRTYIQLAQTLQNALVEPDRDGRCVSTRSTSSTVPSDPAAEALGNTAQSLFPFLISLTITLLLA